MMKNPHTWGFNFFEYSSDFYQIILIIMKFLSNPQIWSKLIKIRVVLTFYQVIQLKQKPQFNKIWKI